jgi:hypothetical protein
MTPAAEQAIFKYTPSQYTLTNFYKLLRKDEFQGVMVNGLPRYHGAPQQLPADLAHVAFGMFKDLLRDETQVPTSAAQLLVMKLVQILPR